MSEPIRLRKLSAIIPISEEMLRGPSHDRAGHVEPPSAAERAAYAVWKSKFAPLYKEGQRNGWFSDGGPDYGFEYQPPEGKWVFDES